MNVIAFDIGGTFRCGRKSVHFVVGRHFAFRADVTTKGVFLMTIKRIFAILLVAILCFSSMSVTTFAASTKQYGYTIVNSTKKIDYVNEDDMYSRIVGPHDGKTYYIYETAAVSGGYGKPVETVVDEGICNLFTGPMYVLSRKDVKCYFKADAETKWHRYKNYILVTKPGRYQVKYVWEGRNNTGTQTEIINMNVNKWVPAEIVYDGYLVDNKSVTFWISKNGTPDTAKYYYTLDGSKPTTKSKQFKMSDRITQNKFTIKKTCTFRMLITCPGCEDTYMSLPIGIGKEYTNGLSWGALKDEATVTANTGVFQHPVRIEFYKGDSRGYKFYYTTDGSKPTTKSTAIEYSCDYITIDHSCTLRVLTIDKNGKKQYSAFKYVVDINQSQEMCHLWR